MLGFEEIDLSIDDVLPEAPINNNCTFEINADCLLHKTPLKLVGRPPVNVWRLLHPNFKTQIHVPETFIDHFDGRTYKTSNAFANALSFDIDRLCFFFGEKFINTVSLEKGEGHEEYKHFSLDKCHAKHKMCASIRDYFITHGLEKFINECNQFKIPVEIVDNSKLKAVEPAVKLTINPAHIYTNFDEKNAALQKKIRNCFWLGHHEQKMHKKQAALYGNVIVPKGESSWQLITAIPWKDSYDVEINEKAGDWRVGLIKNIRIIGDRVYIMAYEACSIICDEPIGFVSVSLNDIHIIHENIRPHKLASFEISNFRNSNWPVRFITDSYIALMASQNACQAEMHYSFQNIDIRLCYLNLVKQHADLVSSKSAFIKLLKKFIKNEKELEGTHFNISVGKAQEIVNDLEACRSFYFIMPFNFNVYEFEQKMCSLFDNMKQHRTLKFKAHEFTFNIEDNLESVFSIDKFFTTQPYMVGDLSLCLFKPNFHSIPNLEHFKSLCLNYGRIVKWKVIPQLEEAQFNTLYDSCLTRPYGPAWHDYMTSDVVVACIILSPDIQVFRQKIKEFRTASQIVWIKNAAHCSESKDEAFRDIACFFPTECKTMDELNVEILAELNTHLAKSTFKRPIEIYADLQRVNSKLRRIK